ncbi:MAG: hypothetical protein J7497_10260 [Chitinophagaceae bacterium]|nr:hypothetical protein [Chitinophagaceae bacterium]
MLTVKSTFKLLDVINKHFNNEQDSRIFVSEIEEIMDNKVDLKMNDFATKKDLLELKTELKTEIAEVKTELKTEIGQLDRKLTQEISYLRADFHKLDAGINLNLANSAIVLERSQKEQLKWLIGAMVAIISLAVTVIKLF